MKKVIVILLLAVALYGCSDDTSGPGSGSQTGLWIIAIIPDTLYQGETGWARLNRRIDSSEIKIFIHSVPVTVERTSGDTAFFQVPRGVTTSRVRLYKDDVQAGGDATLNIIPQYVSELKTMVWADSLLSKGYEGDALVIYGIDIPMRRGDVVVKINDRSQPIEFQNHETVVVRIAEGTTSGKIVVHTRGKQHTLRDQEILQHGGTLLDGRVRTLTLRAMEVLAVGRQVNQGREGLVEAPMNIMYLYEQTAVVDASPISSGDSIIVVSSKSDEATGASLELRLKKVGPNEVSGVVRYNSWLKVLEDSAVTDFTISIDRMRWYKDGNIYRFYAAGPDIPKNVPSFVFTERLSSRRTEFTEIRRDCMRGTFELLIEE